MHIELWRSAGSRRTMQGVKRAPFPNRKGGPCALLPSATGFFLLWPGSARGLVVGADDHIGPIRKAVKNHAQ